MRVKSLYIWTRITTHNVTNVSDDEEELKFTITNVWFDQGDLVWLLDRKIFIMEMVFPLDVYLIRINESDHSLYFQ